jgi:hypothetical protein
MKRREEHVYEEFAREFIRRHPGPRPLWPIERIVRRDKPTGRRG